MNSRRILASVIAVSTASAMIFLSGCATQTQRVDLNNDKGQETLRFDYRDARMLSTYLVNDIVQSGRLDRKDGARYVLLVGKVQTKTNQRNFDSDVFIEPIVSGLENYGKVAVTEAISDEMVAQVRELLHDPMFAPSAIAQKGQVAIPDLCLTAKLLEQDNPIDRKTVQVEYYLKFVITDLKTGVRFYSGTTPPIVKRGSNKTVSW